MQDVLKIKKSKSADRDMKEIREIIKAFDIAVAAGKRTALASVVLLDGSSYRRPGARLLIDDEGQITGAISGGCLEGDALRKALLVIAQQNAKLVTYDTTDEEDMSFGIQLGCAGIIRVLFEPIDIQSSAHPVNLLKKVITQRQKAVLVTLFSIDPTSKQQMGTCLLLEENGQFTGTIPLAYVEKMVMYEARKVLASEASLFKNFEFEGQTITAFFEFLQPAISLVVVGAGNDAIPVVNIANEMGWEARVVDGRNTHAKPERFTSACQVLVSKPEHVLHHLQIDAQTVFVLMTHNYNYDLAMLQALLERKVSYIGVLGPRKKLDRMLVELADKGMQITAEQLKTIYGPVGLEIGAETAEEIALSIIAEIQSVFSGKKGSSLRDSKNYIHSRSDTQIKD